MKVFKINENDIKQLSDSSIQDTINKIVENTAIKYHMSLEQWLRKVKANPYTQFLIKYEKYEENKITYITILCPRSFEDRYHYDIDDLLKTCHSHHYTISSCIKD